MRFVFYAVLSLVTLAVGAGAFFYVALPTDFVRDQIAAQVRERTGRSLTVAGSVSVSFYPDVTVDLSDVTLSPPQGMPGEAFLTVRSLGLKVPLWPLFQHKLIVERFILDRPVIVFRTDKSGRRSWDFAASQSDAGNSTTGPNLRGGETDGAGAGVQPAAAAPGRPRIDALAGLQFGDVRINSGTIRFADDRTGLNEQLSDVSLQLKLASMDGPLSADGELSWSGEPMAVNAEISPASGLLSGAQVTTTTNIRGPNIEGTYKGRLALAEANLLTGRLDVKTASLRDLLRWLRHPLPQGPGLATAALVADITATSHGMKAQNATAHVDAMTAKGSFAIDSSGPKPKLSADLNIDRLDLNTYLVSGAAAKPGNDQASSTAAVKAAKDTGKPDADQPADAAGAWSAAPIDVPALRMADAEIALTMGGLQFQKIKIDRGQATASLKDGSLRTRFNELQLYGGKGTGTVLVDGHAAAAKIEASFALKSVQMLPLLQDAAGLGRLSGRGNVAFGFTGSGRSQRDIVKTLLGQGRMEVADGTLIGYDVPQMVRGLQNGSFGNWQDNPVNKTAFSMLTATATMTNGIMASDDLALVSPALRMLGTGKADLPAQTVDDTLKPAIMAASDNPDQPAGATASIDPALSLPVRVTGPWAHPKFALDLGAIAKNPSAALNAVKQALGKVKGGNKVQDAVAKLANSKEGKAIGNLLGGLLGKKPAQDGETGLGLGADPAPAQ